MKTQEIPHGKQAKEGMDRDWEAFNLMTRDCLEYNGEVEDSHLTLHAAE